MAYAYESLSNYSNESNLDAMKAEFKELFHEWRRLADQEQNPRFPNFSLLLKIYFGAKAPAT